QVKLLQRDVNHLQKLQVEKIANQANVQAETPRSIPTGDTPGETRIPLAERIKPLPDELKRPETMAPATRIDPAREAPVVVAPAPAPIAKPAAAQPRAYEPGPADKLFAAIGRFFTEGNPIVRVGMVVMFFGMSFLVKYAASEGFIPLELRLAAVAAIALALVILGWKTRERAGGYGLVLQGGGIAALYLTIFAALKLYSLLPPGVSLALMLVLVMLGATLAILQNAQVLALIAT